MSTIDLTKYGITDVKEIVHNPSYEVLFAEETKPELVRRVVNDFLHVGNTVLGQINCAHKF